MAPSLHRRLVTRGVASIAVVALVAACGAGGDPAEAPSSARAENGTVTLWDGSGLEDWSQAGPGQFAVVQTPDGPVLETRGGLGLLWYEPETFPETSSGFTLRLQWRTESADDNSGVFLGFPDPGDDPWVAVEQGYEVQIYDGAGGDPQKTGSVYGVEPLAESSARPPGTWNQYEITVADGELTVVLNGEPVNSVPLERGSFPGHVGLQNHGAEDRVQFRDIVITPTGDDAG